MKNRSTIQHNRKSLLLAIPMALILMVAVFLASRHDGGRAAAAVMPASPEKTAQVDSTVRSEAMAVPTVSIEEREAENEPVAEAEKAVSEEREAARTIGSGEASYYGSRFAGRSTANGETFNPAKLTAAHKTLPFGSRVRVTNMDNGRSVVVRVNDRGPYVHGRLIDVSQGAAEVLGMVSQGTANVRLELLTSG